MAAVRSSHERLAAGDVAERRDGVDEGMLLRDVNPTAFFDALPRVLDTPYAFATLPHDEGSCEFAVAESNVLPMVVIPYDNDLNEQALAAERAEQEAQAARSSAVL